MKTIKNAEKELKELIWKTKSSYKIDIKIDWDGEGEEHFWKNKRRDETGLMKNKSLI